MGWVELQAWIEVACKQTEPRTTSVDSWEGASEDPWWQQAKADRARERGW